MAKVRILLQEFLKISTIFLFCFVWIRYFVRKFVPAIAISAALSILLYTFIFFINKKVRKKSMLKLKEKENAQNIFITLSLRKNSGEIIEKIAKNFAKILSTNKNYVLCQKSDNDEMTAIYFDDDLQGLSAQKLFEIHSEFKNKDVKKIVILCKEISDKKVFDFLGVLDAKFIIFDQYETYEKLYKKYQIFPEIETKLTKNKAKFKDIIAYSFNKKRTKGYLFSAFLLIISGVFVRASLYYCVISSILLVFAIFSYFNPRFNQKESISL